MSQCIVSCERSDSDPRPHHYATLKTKLNPIILKFLIWIKLILKLRNDVDICFCVDKDGNNFCVPLVNSHVQWCIRLYDLKYGADKVLFHEKSQMTPLPPTPHNVDMRFIRWLCKQTIHLNDITKASTIRNIMQLRTK